MSRRRHERLDRRGFLRLSAGTAAGVFFGPLAVAQEAAPLRVGVVLPLRQGGGRLRSAAQTLAGEAARKGGLLAEERSGGRLELLLASAPDGEAALRAAERFVALEEVSALVGGVGREQAFALSDAAERHELPFLNIGAADEGLRGAPPSTFHVEARAVDYLRAIGRGLGGRAKSWYLLHGTDATSRELQRTTRRLLEREEFGHVVGALEIEASEYTAALDEIARTSPEVVLALFDWRAQLDFLGHYEAMGMQPLLTGFPYPETQTRDYLASVGRAAPVTGAGMRAALWEASIASDQAGELNASFSARWGRPMDPPAWAAYAALAWLAEAYDRYGEPSGITLSAELSRTELPASAGKGSHLAACKDDRQLQQPLYLIDVAPESERLLDLASVIGEVMPVGC